MNETNVERGDRRGSRSVDRGLRVLCLLAAGTTSCSTTCRVALVELALQSHSKGTVGSATSEVSIGPAAAPEQRGRGWAVGPVAGFMNLNQATELTHLRLLYLGGKVHYYFYRAGMPIPQKGGELIELFALGSSVAIGPAWAWHEGHGQTTITYHRGLLTEGELFARLTLIPIAFTVSAGAELAPEFNGVFARVSVGVGPSIMGRR